MVSKSTHTEAVRKRKSRTRGKARKSSLQNKGTTLSREELFKVEK